MEGLELLEVVSGRYEKHWLDRKNGENEAWLMLEEQCYSGYLE
jgi:hypothetical protein